MAIWERIKAFYYINIKKYDFSSYNILKMRKRGIVVGDNCRIFSDITSNEPTLISIGDNVTISSDVRFITHDNAIIKSNTEMTDIVGRISVGNNVFIGMRSIILLGVSIGDNCIIGAGAVVTKSVPNGMVVAGNPAKIVCRTADYYEKNKKYGIKMTEIKDCKERYFNEHSELLIKKGFMRFNSDDAL